MNPTKRRNCITSTDADADVGKMLAFKVGTGNLHAKNQLLFNWLKRRVKTNTIISIAVYIME